MALNTEYTITSEQFSRIKRVIQTEFDQQHTASKFEVVHTDLSVRPTSVELKAIETRELKRVAKRAAKKYDLLHAITAGLPKEEPGIDYRFQFLRDRASHNWTFDYCLIRNDIDKLTLFAGNGLVLMPLPPRLKRLLKITTNARLEALANKILQILQAG